VQIPMPMNARVAARVLVADRGDVAVTDARVGAATVEYLAELGGAKERVMTLTNAAPNMMKNVCSILRGWQTSFLRSAVRDVNDSTASRTRFHCVWFNLTRRHGRFCAPIAFARSCALSRLTT